MIQTQRESRRVNPRGEPSVVRDRRNRERRTDRHQDFDTIAVNSLRLAGRGSQMNDREVMRHCATGDEGAFAELVNRYKDGVYAFLRRFLNRPDLVDDVFQETFLQVYVSRNTFDQSRPLRPWLFTIAANKAKDALRRSKRVDSINFGSVCNDDDCSVDDVLDALDHDEHVPCDDLIKDERAAAVEEVVSRMPERLREILTLAYFQKCSYAEISEILRIPIGTVKSRLHTAVGRFAQELEPACVM
jgi:RNA polymerase sigma-70 factor, ECF subfamily